MLAGALYDPGDPALCAARARAAAWMVRYNGSLAEPATARLALLRERLGEVGEGAEIRPPFHCDYGSQIRLGAGAFLNFNCVILDGAPVEIGPGAKLGPGVQLLTADHPRDPARRAAGLERALPIRVGANVWIGAGALILPGVTIGQDGIIGAGAVVTGDVAPGQRVAGSPARPLR